MALSSTTPPTPGTSATTSGTSFGDTVKTFGPWVAGGLVAFVAAVSLGSWIHSQPTTPTEEPVTTESRLPLTSQPRSQWRQAILVPGGRTAVLPIWRDLRPVVLGTSFYIECTHDDGKTSKLSPNNSGPCADGPYERVISTSLTNNTITYAWEKRKY